MAEQQQVDWHKNGGFAKMREFFRLVREGPPLRKHQWETIMENMQILLAWCYGLEWVEKYGDEATKQIKQGILDK